MAHLFTAFDTETHLAGPFSQAPPLVCLVHAGEDEVPFILDREGGVKFGRQMLEEPGLIVGHNVAYDLSVLCAADPSLMPLIWQAYDDERIRDTMIRAQLIAIAEDTFRWDKAMGRSAAFDLGSVAEKWTGLDVDKKDDWRMRYAELDGVPLSDWPEGALRYALRDGRATAAVWRAVREHEPPDETLQVRAAWSLQLARSWGLRCDLPTLKMVRAELEEYCDAGEKRLDHFFKPKYRSRPSRRMDVIKERVEQAYAALGEDVPLTKTGLTQTSSQALIESKDPELGLLGDILDARSILSKFIPKIFAVVHPSFKVLVRSGRTSCREPNVQQLPRARKCLSCMGSGYVQDTKDDCPNCEGSGHVVGVREMFVPRPGWMYIDSDYSGVELCALAEVCYQWFGFSEMGEALKAGMDLHVLTASDILEVSYEELLQRKNDGDREAKEYRQIAKAENFGFPGGLMKPSTVVDHAFNSYGARIAEEDVPRHREIYLNRYPEMRLYFKRIEAMGHGHVHEQIRSGRQRGGLGFTDGCNTPFQGLAADGAKESMHRIQRACWNEPESPLWGSRMVNFIHDEFLLETPADKVEEAVPALESLMIAGMSQYITRVPIKVETTTMTRFGK